MISIICPCYNSAETIKRVFDSISSQKDMRFKIEVIFIDDGSTDNTIDLISSGIKRLRAEGITAYLYDSPHKGPGAARNIGIKKSIYKYIAFIDSDDIWYERKIAVCEQAILANPNSNIFVHDETYMRINRENSTIVNGVHENPLDISLYVRNCLSTSAVIVEKELLMKHGYFDERLMSSQDWDLWLKLSPYLVLCKINDILGEYHETSGSITAKFYLYRVFDQLLIAHRYRRYVKIHQYCFKIFKIIFSKQWFYGLKNIFFGNKSHNC
jgi:glycosyltransferase involved in cell wall biosynthesis